ncbi:short-chain dehydrogenase/reductase [Pestalotiopsis sp. NC0098]|nr:short-chain dehydrogenase/reductase [Pestalotiopsis sp. NC0098]
MSQKTVLITGCSDGGIGAALAAEFHRRGCRVFATARNVDKMQSLRALRIEAVAMDVTSDASIAQAVAEVERATAGGSLDLLVNNAGVHHFMPFADSKPEDFRRVIDTNITAVFVVTHAFLPLLMRARGVVANIGSVQEVFCLPFQSAYNASKAAVHAMAHTLRVELKPLGVRFVTVVTGGVKTRLYDNAPVELPADSLYAPIAHTIEGREFIHNVRRDDAEDYARAVVADLLRPEPRWTLWHGSQSTLAWFLSWFGWDGMIDSSIAEKNGLHELKIHPKSD